MFHFRGPGIQRGGHCRSGRESRATSCRSAASWTDGCSYPAHSRPFRSFLASGDIEATQAPLCLHPHDEALWKMLDVQCQAFGVPYSPVPDPDYWIQDGETLSFGSVSGQALHTPGHTPGSLSFYFAGQQLVLSGDTLFRGGIRTHGFVGRRRACHPVFHPGATIFPGSCHSRHSRTRPGYADWT